MHASRPRTLFIAIASFLCSGGVAWANSLAPFIWLWPGVVILAGWESIPATVLAAVIERPFVQSAGLKVCPLAYSLQANAISLLAGLLAVPIVGEAIYSPLSLIVPLVAVCCSIFVESKYLKFQAQRQNLPFQRLPIAFGNLCSSFVLIAVSACLDTRTAEGLPWNSPQLWSGLLRLQPALNCSIALFAAALIASFFFKGASASAIAVSSGTRSEPPVDAELATRPSPVD